MPINGGPAAARNRGIALAKGRWLAVLDSDDVYAPDRLRTLIEIAERHGADIIADDLIVFDEANPASATFFLPPSMAAGWIDTAEYLAQTRMYGGGANLGYLKPIIRRERLGNEGMSYNEALKVGEDDDFILRMLLAGFSYWLEPSPLYAYRKHDSSISHRLSANAAIRMSEASERLCLQSDGNVPEDVARSLAERRAAIAKAAGFAKLIEALKQRNLLRAGAIALRHPSVIPLLHMPLRAAVQRLRPAQRAEPGVPKDTRAVAALAQIRFALRK